MSLEEAWNSNPNSVARIIKKIREAQNPEENKPSNWSRKELLEFMRENENA